MSDDEEFYDEYFDDDFLWFDDGDAMLVSNQLPTPKSALSRRVTYSPLSRTIPSLEQTIRPFI